jgi:hypothetical protein
MNVPVTGVFDEMSKSTLNGRLAARMYMHNPRRYNSPERGQATALFTAPGRRKPRGCRFFDQLPAKAD